MTFLVLTLMSGRAPCTIGKNKLDAIGYPPWAEATPPDPWLAGQPARRLICLPRNGGRPRYRDDQRLGGGLEPRALESLAPDEYRILARKRDSRGTDPVVGKLRTHPDGERSRDRGGQRLRTDHEGREVEHTLCCGSGDSH